MEKQKLNKLDKRLEAANNCIKQLANQLAGMTARMTKMEKKDTRAQHERTAPRKGINNAGYKVGDTVRIIKDSSHPAYWCQTGQETKLVKVTKFYATLENGGRLLNSSIKLVKKGKP